MAPEAPKPPPMRPLRISIFHKLVGLAVAIITSVVAALTVHAISYRRSEMAQLMAGRVRWVAQLAASQTRSAVAFDDRATAREVLSALEKAVDFAAVVLYDQHGQVLYQSGHPSRWLSAAARGVIDVRVVAHDDRVAAVYPVRSLEGPWGTLVVELSTVRMQAREREAMLSSLLVAGVAMVLSLGAMWLLARSLTRRLRAIASVATAVARGDLARRAKPDPSQDEIGVVARAFGVMLEQLAQAQRGLEDRVAERTAALVDSKRELEREMADRARMEVELRQAQKLEAVGRLAAGVAHEINTPIQFVSDSCTFLQDAVGDLSALLAGYRKTMVRVVDGELALADAAMALADLEAGSDVAYLLDEMPKATARSVEGLERVATIVRSLKEFAHPERAERSAADLNRAIETTLTIARNEYRYVADLRTELAELPPIECHIGALNQALLNIIVNGAHAIASVVEGTDQRGEIVVTTALDGDDGVVISIADTGIGIPAELLGKIFDPFFTTKEVGKGTGQGLALVHAVVVEQHGGKVEVESRVGQGTTFRLRLPVAWLAATPRAAA